MAPMEVEKPKAKRAETPPPRAMKQVPDAAKNELASEGLRQRQAPPEPIKPAKEPSTPPPAASKVPVKKAEGPVVPSERTIAFKAKSLFRGLLRNLMKPFQATSAAYMHILTKFPLIVKAVSAAFISMIGAIICQLVVEGAENLDIPRVGRFVALQGAIVAPIMHFWFIVLNRVISRAGFSGALLRMITHEFLMQPCFAYGSLVYLQSLPAGNLILPSNEEVLETITSGLKLFPAANLLIFWALPVNLHVLGGNVVSLAWSVYLSGKGGVP